MKTTKRLASLFLALLMALSCMAMPAMAAGDEVMRKPGMRCPQCGGFAWIDSETSSMYILDCEKCGTVYWPK